MRQVGVLVRLDETPGSVKGPAPALGQHTEEALGLLEAAPAVRGATNGAVVELPANPSAHRIHRA